MSAMNWESLILVLIFLAAAYTILPDFLLHYMGIGSWKHQYTPGVAITFDDGPDPEITPKILDILRKHNCPATFFVVGKKAAQYPEIIRLIRSQGHILGSHCYQHRFAWFMSPWSTWWEWDKSIAILEEITGEPVAWIRPPWGTFNLSTWFWLKSRQKHAVLWNTEGHDWSARTKPGQISARILDKVQAGSIILLHDAGGDKGAPENTLAALDELCQRIVQDKKLPLAALEFPQWSSGRKMIFTMWSKWEQVFARIYKVERISASNVFRLSINHYHGPNLYTPAGTLLAQNGDPIGELHFDSLRLQGEETDMLKTGVRLLRLGRESLPALARYVHEHPDYEGIEVFAGLTLLYQSAKLWGFQVHEMPNTLSLHLIGFVQKLMIFIYHSANLSELKKFRSAQPKLVWISRQQLLEKWLPLQL
jgi:peptidoglycan-N-acetylglucosamine deacetylase